MALLTACLLLVLAGEAAPASQPGSPPASRPVPRAARPANGNWVTWVGFKRIGDMPRVFVQLSSPARVSQELRGHELVLTIPDFDLDNKNNSRPLDTRFFHTDIAEIAAVHVGSFPAGVEVHVKFVAGRARLSETTMSSNDEGTLLYMDFPGGGKK